MKKNVIKICHIADIHIRARARHEEYRSVFSNLSEDLKKREVDYVWIGGDTWHTKLSNISPEYISFLPENLKKLSKHSEVHMMLGNHDGNMVNLERSDAISPIIEVINDPRIKIYKDSGVYPLNESVNWCVYSPFDSEKWKEVEPEIGKYNIACFHGGVRGAKTASGWEIEGEKNVSDFDKFDIALLGDIHKVQFLGDYNPPRIGYCGSLIQQSFDEDLEHGYLLWEINLDTKERKVEFIKIDGGKPFITLRVNEENYKDISSSSVKDFENVRCRIICEDLNIVQKNSLKDFFISAGSEEVIILESEKNEKDIKKQISETVKLDSEDSLLDQIRIYSEKKSKLPWSSLEKEIKSYAKKTNLNSVKSHRWTLKRFKFDNLYSYAENNEIDFSKFEGLCGIIGPNASGKSSILGSLLFTLFNGSDRDCSKNAFYINDSKDSAKAICDIEIDGNNYQITRLTNRSATNRESSTTKLFLKSSKENLTGEQRNDTDKLIKDLIGSSDDFMMTSMAVQEDLGKFLKEGSTTRKEIISRFLGIDCLYVIHNMAKKDLSAKKNERKVLGLTSLEIMKEEQIKNEEIKKKIVVSISQKEKDLNSLNKEIFSLESSIRDKGLTTESKSEIISKIEKYELQKKSYENDIKNCNEKKNKCIAEIENYQKDISLIESLDISKKLKEAIAIKDSLNAAKISLASSEQKLKSAEKSSLKLLDVPCEDAFPTCKFITESHKDKSSLPALREQFDSFSNNVEKIAESMSKLNIEELLQKSKTKESLLHSLNENQKTIEKLENLVEKLKTSIADIEKNIESYTSKLEFIDENTSKKLTVLKQQYSKTLEELNSMYFQIGSLETNITTLEKNVELCKNIDEKISLYEEITEIFSKDGFPKFILSQHLSLINSSMNSLLSKITNFKVDLVLNDDKGNLEVIMEKAGKRRIAELGSGMERTLISLAMRVALREISCMPMPDFFVIDEGFSMLDSDNVAACKLLLQHLKKIFRFVLVMTHNDVIKEMMDKTIEVTLDGDFSKLDAKI